MPEENLVSWLILIMLVVYVLFVAVKAAFLELQEREYEYIREERKR